MRYLITIIVLITMSFSNPTRSEFGSFLSSHIKKEMIKKGETKETSNLAGGIVSLFAKKNVERSDFVFASYYYIDMSTLRDFGAETKDIKMLGIFNTFIPLSR